MIPPTISWVKESHFMAKYFGTSLVFEITAYIDSNEPLVIKISPNGDLEIFYKKNLLLKENIVGDESNFGIESLDMLSRAIACLDNGSDNWKDYVYIEK